MIRSPVATPETPWTLHLICCGYDDGRQYFDSWASADAFRWEYMAPGPHRRAALLEAPRPATPDTEETNG